MTSTSPNPLKQPYALNPAYLGMVCAITGAKPGQVEVSASKSIGIEYVAVWVSLSDCLGLTFPGGICAVQGARLLYSLPAPELIERYELTKA